MKTLTNLIEKKGYCIIAEIGVNYYDMAKKNSISNLEAAKLMCKEAHDAGADVVKFQTYKAGKIASKFSPSYWDTSEESTTSQYELFLKYDLFNEKDYSEIASYCNELGVIFTSTPFDFESADYLNKIMDYYKISSSDLTNIPFIEHICQKNKPIILSTGASCEDEIELAVNTINKYNNELSLLHCVLEYPTPYEHANLSRIIALKNKYPNTIIGYSDHTKPDSCSDVIQTAYLLGARIIEKHFTLDKTLPGNDHYHAMDPNDLRNIIKTLDFTNTIMGNESLDYLNSEKSARENARRSIVLTHDKKKGEVIDASDITFKRPGIGISPQEYNSVIGKKLAVSLTEDTILQWQHIE